MENEKRGYRAGGMFRVFLCLAFLVGAFVLGYFKGIHDTERQFRDTQSKPLPDIPTTFPSDEESATNRE